MCVMLWFSAGCASLEKNADPAVVRAEQTLSIAFDTMNTFLKLENQFRDETIDKAPDVHKFAEWLREPVSLTKESQPLEGVTFSDSVRRGLAIIESANRVKNVYKSNRTPENKEKLIAALAAVEAALAETQKHIANLRKD